jgi:hypothetical protein
MRSNPMDAGASPQKPKLLDRVRHAIRVRHMAISTEKTQIYTHVLQSNSWAIQSPADEI